MGHREWLMVPKKFGNKSHSPNPPTFFSEAFRFTPVTLSHPFSNLLSFFLSKICSW